MLGRSIKSSSVCYHVLNVFRLVLNVFYICVLENRQRSLPPEVASAEKRQICIVVDGLAADLSFEDARILFLSKAEGYGELAVKLEARALSVQGFKIVILLLGRSEVWETDKLFLQNVERAIMAIRSQNEQAIIRAGRYTPVNS